MKNVTVTLKENIPFTARQIHSILAKMRTKVNFSVDRLEISFISGDDLLKINKKYLRHKYRTDIITFDYSEAKDVLDGELLISADDARENARKYGVTEKEELMRLVVHGVLHLLGFDDKSAAAKKLMMQMQEKIVEDIYSKIR